ncbi:MAG: beta-galactosidase [Microcoleus vaginatus WJT46-NPBG5]|nr:beta-galactosidase [Microcoleus vaginatus WJT46-NPBG5]
MTKKITKVIGIFLLTIFIFAGIGSQIHKGNSANCPVLQLAKNTAGESLKIPNSKRDEIYLNGIWKFIPALGGSQQLPPQTGWGSIWVPGDWQRENHPSVPGIISRGTGTAWQNFNGKQLSKAWYQSTISIPAEWQGRTILLDLTRLSTDAEVYVNGIQCGQIQWPYGAADITTAVKPGSSAVLSLLVTAAADEKEKAVIMGPNEIYKTESTLESRGLIGEVRLLSRPAKSYISDVFVQPSTRNNQIKLDVELTDIKEAGKTEIIAQMLNEKGKIEREFTGSTNVTAKPTQTVQIAWDWPHPRLWDIGRPNLYTLRLQVRGSGIEDEYHQEFGFREFWIERRKFYLNGTELRLRPILYSEEWANGIPEVGNRIIDSYLWAGFNIAELWPWNHNERGKSHFRELFAGLADQKGFPLIGPALDMTNLAWSGRWKNPENRERWEQQMLTELRRYRNHPSILLWGSNSNFFGYNDDQNPRRIGKKKVEGTLGKDADKRFQEISPVGEAVVATIKKHDPTRPVLVHQGAAVGDVYALNCYLNMIPLQEREEWLSQWTQQGDMPYMAVEFGTPLHTTMMRGRKGFGNAILSEPLMTEFSAIYLGKEAYELETPAYRAKIRELFVGDGEYKSWHFNPQLDFAPAFQKLQQLFITNTWRSWRTFGITGGMIPWNNGHGWQVSEGGKQTVDLGPFKPGRRGPYLQQVPKSLWHAFQMEANTIHPAGIALLENNGPTLAWIAGSEPAFTAKDHSFKVGETLQKQVVLINDLREKQTFSFEWQVTVKGQKVGTGQNQGNIEPTQTLFFPLAVDLPKTLAAEKVEGEIRLSARIGSRQHQDRFSFRVFSSSLATGKGEIAVFDPAGQTTAMLQQMGYTVKPWAGSDTPQLLVIGREALSSEEKRPGNLEAFVRKGGRAIIFTQNSEWLQRIGLRVSPHLSRRVFPVDETHPVVAGLDALDLRDWRGESSLVEAYPDTRQGGMRLSPSGLPWYGWHWGNRGAVSSVPVEKPHHSSWRPILESEFDLAYTPLMELDYGKGRLIWNGLDLEDHYAVEVPAAKLAQQMIEYAQTAPLSPKANKVILIGSEADAGKLDALGAIYRQADSLETNPDLVIIGSEAKVKDEDLQAYLNAGGKVFFLPAAKPATTLGVQVQEVKNFGGSLAVPNWPEVRGISASDLRWRSFHDAWLIQSGGEVAADGLLSRVVSGKGVAIFSQIDPDALEADTNTYFRYSRWRQTRAISQILANMGASFKADRQIFKPVNNPNRFYHPDYQTDFEQGDDPYRYYRW